MNKFLFLDERVFKENKRAFINCSHITTVECRGNIITFVMSNGDKYSFNIREIFPIISFSEEECLIVEIFDDFRRFLYDDYLDDYLDDCLEFNLYSRLKKALDHVIMLSIRG